uniref:Retrovirus-related Pol polyprotein from transposon TNT 1-94-like beta-barrel domain-containing protein n=1 Tax=Peronospora matthiolae TaxID=2874970 RepID=A0AAV1VF27_9STRA
MNLFMKNEEVRRIWAEHFLYKVAVSDARELAHFAQSIKLGSVEVGREVVAALVEAKHQDTQTCFRCGRTGHAVGNTVLVLTEKASAARANGNESKEEMRARRKTARASDTSDNGPAATCAGGFVLAEYDAIGIDRGVRILASCASIHLVNDESLLVQQVVCVHEITMADGETLRMTRVGSVRLELLVRGAKTSVALSEVYFAPRLAMNIVFYGKLNVLYNKTTSTRERHSSEEVIIFALEALATNDDADGAHEASLLHWHQRLGHLAFDTIGRTARDPASGIRLTRNKRMACMSCLKGKQTRNAQSQQDSGANSPIDRIGGFICSGLNIPMKPQDHLGNRYLVNFIDHKSNYYRTFLARTKDAVAKQFDAFLVHFKKLFGFKVLVLLMDGGGE